MEERVCSNCSGLVAASDKACRYCGVSLDAVIRPSGSFVHEFLRVALGVWSLTLPVLCVWAALTAPKGLSDFSAYFTSQVYFIPWIVIIIPLAILTWLTEERR